MSNNDDDDEDDDDDHNICIVPFNMFSYIKMSHRGDDEAFP